MPAVVEQVGPAAIVRMDWPMRRNALGPSEAAELARAIESAGGSAAKALILTGSGAFCAGGDLRAFADLSAALTPAEIRKDVYGNVQAIVRALRHLPIPSIAAVDGAAIGLGMDLALACDVRFVGPEGWMRQGWSRLGLISAGGGSWFLDRTRRGLLWQLLGDQPRLGPTECVALELANPCETSNAVQAGLELAEKLSSIPSDVIAAYTRLSREAQWPSEEFLSLCADYQSEFIGGEHFRSLANSLLAASERPA